MLENGNFLGAFDISHFCGKAVIIKIPEGTNSISKSLLLEYSYVIEHSEFVLFNTGWSKFWGSLKYFEYFPLLSKEAVTYLISFNLKGIGFDAISVDALNSADYFNHYLLFEKGLIIIENIVFPDNLNMVSGELFCFPLKFAEADGSPVRAVLKVED
jgi:kynurenine formamidase